MCVAGQIGIRSNRVWKSQEEWVCIFSLTGIYTYKVHDSDNTSINAYQGNCYVFTSLIYGQKGTITKRK